MTSAVGAALEIEIEHKFEIETEHTRLKLKTRLLLLISSNLIAIRSQCYIGRVEVGTT